MPMKASYTELPPKPTSCEQLEERLRGSERRNAHLEDE